MAGHPHLFQQKTCRQNASAAHPKAVAFSVPGVSSAGDDLRPEAQAPYGGSDRRFAVPQREADLHPDWVAGISIGAINSAIIAGDPPKRRVDALREFWHTVSISPLGIPSTVRLT